jgi:hypothetical protein
LWWADLLVVDLVVGMMKVWRLEIVWNYEKWFPEERTRRKGRFLFHRLSSWGANA